MDPVILIMLNLDGSWDSDYNFNCNDKFGMHIRYSAKFGEFVSELSSILIKYKSHNHFSLSYMVDQCPPPVCIHDEESFRFFLDLKLLQYDIHKYPLCVEFPSDIAYPRIASVSHADVFHSPVSSQETCPNPHHSAITTNSKEGNYSNGDDHVQNATDCIPLAECNDDSYSSPCSDSIWPPSPRSHSSSSEIYYLHQNSEVITHYHPTQITVDDIYQSKADLIHHLMLYAIDNGFQYTTRTSKKTQLHVVCKGEECKWAVRAVKLRGVQMFQIRRFDSSHSCSVDYRQGKHRQATYRTVAELISHKYLDASRKPYVPNEIRDDMRLMHGISMSYKKAWKAQKLAMQKQFGSDAESYQILPSMAHMLKNANPSSFVDVTTDDNDVFRYFFMSLA
ncbi:unnamed protein product, partial [Cuscuta epithymum]